MLKLINPDTLPESQELYLYWIRSEGMKDMSSEGYIGVTTNIKNRYGGHDLRLRSGSTDISEHFVQAYQTEDFLIMEVINAGSRSVIEIEEHALRPEPNIGWNIKVGGNGSGYAEKLYSQKLVASFRRLVRQSGDFMDINFKGEQGLKVFCNIFSDFHVPKHYSLVLSDESKGMFLDNIVVKKTQQYCDEDGFLFYEGRYLTRKEASTLFGVHKKTIDKRMQYGFTPRQAVGLDEYIRKNVVKFELGGKEVFILDNGSTNMDVNFYKEAYEHYTSGNRTFTKFCKDNNMFGANVTRFFKKFGLKSKVDLRSRKEELC